MKWNWGKGILVVFCLFAAGMFALVYASMKQKVQMVSPAYYQDELAYQQLINAGDSAKTLSTAPTLTKSGEYIILQLPVDMEPKPITGTIHFYCAAEAANDVRFVLQTDTNGRQLITAGRLAPARYTVKIKWQQNGKAYYTEKEFLP